MNVRRRARLCVRLREELEAMMARKPDLGSEDPDDIAAIEHSQKHLGDYKLKTSRDCIVPEDQVNAEKKRRQWCFLKKVLSN